jgi:hypothetical protein
MLRTKYRFHGKFELILAGFAQITMLDMEIVPVLNRRGDGLFAHIAD